LIAASVAANSAVMHMRRATVRELNNRALQWQARQGLPKGPVYPVHRWHDAPADGPVAQRAQEFVNQPNFFELTHVALGARVIFNVTDCKRTGATNSKTGVVEAIVFGEPPEEVSLPAGERWLQQLHVRLDTDQLVTVDRSIVKTIHPNRVPVSKHTMPIMLATAQTGHRAQVGRRSCRRCSVTMMHTDSHDRVLAGCSAGPMLMCAHCKGAS
jgi:hypothetical protein